MPGRLWKPLEERTCSKRQPKSSIKSARPPSDIEVLCAHVRQIEERRRRVTTALPFGLAEIDARLPVGGLRLGRCMRSPVAATARSTGRRLPSPSPLSRRGRARESPAVSRPVRSLRPRPRPGRPEIGPVIYLKVGDEKTVLDCFEKGLRHVGLGAVVAEVARFRCPHRGGRSNSPPKAREVSALRCVVGVARLRRPISDNRQPRRGGGSPPCPRRRCPCRAWGVRGGSSSSSAARRARARISNWRRAMTRVMPVFLPSHQYFQWGATKIGIRTSCRSTSASTSGARLSTLRGR